MDDLLWTSAGEVPLGGGKLLPRLGGGTRPYLWTMYGNVLPAFRALAACPGGKATVNNADFWSMLDYLSNVVLHHRQYTAGGQQGSHRYEGMSITSGFDTDLEGFARNQIWPTAVNSNNPPLAWEYETQPTPAVHSVGFTREVDVLYELATSPISFTFGTENHVFVRYNVPVSREEARLPPKSCFTITVNGQTIAIDETDAVVAGDPRTNGAIQARWSVIALFLSPTDLQAKIGRPNLIDSDVVTLAADYSALPSANKPVTLDGQELPGFTATAATLKSAATSRPDPLETVSFGSFADPTNAPKAIFVTPVTTYLSSKFGVFSSDAVRQILVGIRGKVSPITGTSFGSQGLLLGQGVNSTQFRHIMNPTGAIAWRNLGRTGIERNGFTGGGVFPTNEGLSPVEHVWWYLVDMPNSGGSIQYRRDNTNFTPIALPGSWASDAESPDIGSVIGTVRFSLLGLLDGSTTLSPQSSPTNSTRLGVKELYVAIGTDDRPITGVDLTTSVFGPSQDWGSRGQNILPGRADYAGRTDGGIPEFYFCPTVDIANQRVFNNFGLWNLMSGFMTGPLEEGTGPFFQLA